MARLTLFLIGLFLFFPSSALAEDILIRYKKGTSAEEKRELRPSADIVDKYSLVPRLELIQGASLKELRANKNVLYAYREHRRRPATNDEFFSLQWGVKNSGQTILGSTGSSGADANIEPAWDFEKTGPGIAIIDSGIDLDHPDLNIWTNPGEVPANGIDDDLNGYIDDVRGWNFIDENNNPNDTDGHGSHVAGIVGAKTDNSIGVAGVNWGSSLAALKVCGEFCLESDIIAAIEYAVSEGFRISNNSYGGGGYAPAEEAAIAAARDAGHLYVAAAGNDSQSLDTNPSYPASYNLANIISVAATDNKDTLSSFSNYGETVDIAAPGTSIASTYKDAGYVYLSGTSMASPFVAGVANLVAGQNPAWGYSQIRAKVLENARLLPSLTGKTEKARMLDGGAAVQGDLPSAPAIIVKPSLLSNDKNPLFQWSVESGDSSLCSLNGGAWEACSSPKTYEGLSDGTYTFAVKAVNIDGESPEAAWTWVQDTTAPAEPTLTEKPAAKTNSNTLTFAWSGDERAYCKWDALPYRVCASPFVARAVEDGEHTFSVIFRDEAGNESPAATWSGAVRSVAPAAPEITERPPLFINKTSARLYFKAAFPTECRLGFEAFFPCQSPLLLDNLRQGSHRVEIRQIDDYQNISKEATVSFTVDTASPIVKKAVASKRGRTWRVSVTFSDSLKIEKAELSRNKKKAQVFLNPKNTLTYKSKAAPKWIRLTDEAGNTSSWRAVKTKGRVLAGKTDKKLD